MGENRTPGGKHLTIRKQNLAFPINVAIFYKEAYILDVLAKREIILFLVSKCTILGSEDAKVEGESLFKKLTCDHQSWNIFARETIATIKNAKLLYISWYYLQTPYSPVRNGRNSENVFICIPSGNIQLKLLIW